MDGGVDLGLLYTGVTATREHPASAWDLLLCPRDSLSSTTGSPRQGDIRSADLGHLTETYWAPAASSKGCCHRGLG